MFDSLFRSVVFRIGILILTISLLALVSMTSSVLISHRAESDAYAVNLSGSLRMQSYRLLYHFSQGQASIMRNDIAEFEKTLYSSTLQNNTSHPALSPVIQEWEHSLKPALLQAMTPATHLSVEQAIESFVNQLNDAVYAYQLHAEHNVGLIRSIQISSLVLVFGLMLFTLYTIHHLIKRPLTQLTQLARQIASGNFTGRANDTGRDELSLLGLTINHMSEAISKSHATMERTVQRKTADLKRNHQCIEILYEITRELHHSVANLTHLRPLLIKLAKVSLIEDIELCLITPSGQNPYEHIMTKHKTLASPCLKKECNLCVEGHREHTPRISYPLSREGENMGVLVCELGPGQILASWQKQLFQSVAEQISVSLSLRDQDDQRRRLALMHERTVIARELHDSLAQTLSYLKIQVTRLNKTLVDDQDVDAAQPIINELRSGLSSAYRALRELLTTFRLKVDGQNFFSTIQRSLEQLQEQAPSIHIELIFKVHDIPFTPNEEVHLLQISREACQNAIQHSGGTHVLVELAMDEERSHHIRLRVKDDGIGIHDHPSKLNHYGLAIMQERAQSLGGELSIHGTPEVGTDVIFSFSPNYYAQGVDSTHKEVDMTSLIGIANPS